LRIDSRQEAKAAPFQFDVAQGRLHRNGCRLIPKSSRTSLYGVWEIGPEELKLACETCRPVAKNSRNADDENYAMDLLYGMLSVLDQFGGVLRERGRQYRRVQGHPKPRRESNGANGNGKAHEEQVLQNAVVLLDRMLRAVKSADQTLNQSNGRRSGHSSDRPNVT
jgi:hypothetical protein